MNYQEFTNEKIKYLDIGAYSLLTNDFGAFMNYCRFLVENLIKRNGQSTVLPKDADFHDMEKIVLAFEEGELEEFIREAVLKLVSYDGMNLEQFGCYNLDIDIVHTAVAQTTHAFRYAHSTLKMRDGTLHTMYKGDKWVEDCVRYFA